MKLLITIKIALLYSIIIYINSIFALSNNIQLSGKIIDMKTKIPLCGTIIKVKNTDIVVVADREGKFKISGLKPQSYFLECILAEYPRLILKITMPDSEDTSILIELPKSLAITNIFEIGGIKVEAKRDLVPQNYVSTTKISSGEIENLQATNLGDVLEMVPGLEKNNRLGLDRAIHANVLGSSDDILGTFGTKIILDEAPFSNNANLQMSASGTVTNSAGQGIDLRLIPADNIESVEIIRGIPSVKYGDLTSGIIKVKTYSGLMRPRLKIKSNPNTSEANFGTGFKLGKNIINLNLNYGFSQRELRKEGDEFHRFNTTLIASRKLLKEKMPLKFKLYLTRLLDEEKPTDVHRISAYNRGYTINTDFWGAFSPNTLEKYHASLYLHYTRKNTFSSRLVESDPISYIGTLRMIGDEINAGGRIEKNHKFLTKSAIHEITGGLEFQYDNNFGKGLIIDTTRHYYGKDSPLRSYSFDEVPGMTQIGLYLEDRLTTNLWKDFIIVFGIRYDLFKPRKINLSGLWSSEELIKTQHGSFFSPRIGWMIFLTPSTQIRGSIGSSAKIPSMNYIFQPREVGLYKLNYYSYDQSNFNLKGYYVKQFDLGIDQKISDLFSVTLEGYFNQRENEPNVQTYPFFYEINPDTIWVPTYSLYENIGWEKQRGFEVSLRTTSIKGIYLTVNSSYRFNRSGVYVPVYNPNPDPIDSDGDGILDSYDPVWQDIGDRWYKKLLIDYRLEYRSKTLGFWFQLIAHQTAISQTKSNNPYDKGFWANYLRKYPDNWVFSFRLSKSLWWGSEISLYVNNFIDDRGVYEVPWLREYYPDSGSWGRKVYATRNNPIFWGLEFSTKFDF